MGSARATSMLTNFTSGHISPLIEAQIDLKQYFNGGRTLRNIAALPHGPLKKRGGSAYVAATKSAVGKHKLIPFQFNVTQSYILEIGDQYMRFFSERGQVVDGGSPYEIVSPYLSDDIPNINYTQSADVLILVHPNYPPYELLRNGHTDWTLREITWVQIPLKPKEAPEDPDVPYWGSEDGYPGVATFFEQRLVFAASIAYPQTIWCSVIGVYYDFTVSDEVVDDDAVIYTIASDQVNAIRWMLPQSVILVGTKGGEFKFSSSSQGETITPSNAKAVRQTNHGSNSSRPVLIENSALFVQYGGRKVRNLNYDLMVDKYEAEDISILAEDITKSQIKETAYQNNPDSIYWVNTFDGRLVGCTLEKKQGVIAWHDHILAGTNAIVESIANIDDASGDELWLIVERTINGQTVKYVEYLADQLRSSVPEVDRAYTDSYIKNVFETPTSTISNLEHLEGETVRPVVDNWVHPEVVVSEGSITLEEAGSKIVVGLPYTARYMSMRVQAQIADSVTYHMEKRLVRCWVSIYESLGLAAGPENGNIADQLVGNARVMGLAQEYVSKDVEVNIDGGTDTDVRLVIESREPLPLTVLGIVFDLEVATL